MKESQELNELNSRLLEIIDDCKSEEGVTKLQSIYDRLNGNQALQVTGIKERIKNFIYNLSSNHKTEMLQEKIDIAKSEILDTIKQYIFTKDIMKKSNNIVKDMPSDVAISIDNLLNLGLGLEFSEITVKRYPIELPKDVKEKGYFKALSAMSKSYLDNHITSDQIIKKYREQCRQKVKDIEDKSKSFEIEPYYGTKEFMEYRIKYIKECMEKMLQSKRFKGRDDIKSHIDRISEILSEYEKNQLDSKAINEQKDTYKKLETLYKEVVDIEKLLSPEVAEVWEEKLTSIDSYSKDSDFAFLAHTITDGEFNPENIKKLSMQYITPKTLTLKGDYGVIYFPKADNLFAISPKDVENWKISKEDFIESRIFKRVSIYRAHR